MTTAPIEVPQLPHQKFTVLQGLMAEGIADVSKAVAARSTLPILGNIRVTNSNGICTLSTTNLEISVVVNLPTMSMDEFDTTLPSKTFADVVKQLSGMLEFDLNPMTKKTTIRAGRSINNLNGIDAQEFPMLPVVRDVLCVIAGSALMQLVKRITPAAAKDESRPILTGVNMMFGNNVLTCAAADGFRLAVDGASIDRDCTVEVTEKEATKRVPQTFIVPARALLEVIRTIKADDKVTIYAKSNVIIFSTDYVAVSSQIIDGKFPPFEAIIPKTSAMSVTVDRAEFTKAIKTASIFARETANILVCTVKSSGGVTVPSTFTVASHSAGNGDNETSMDAAANGDLEIAFNSRYLLEMMSVLVGGQATLNLNNSAAPGMVTEGSYTFVVMPMHIGGRETKVEDKPKQVTTEGEQVEPVPDPEPEEEVVEEP